MARILAVVLRGALVGAPLLGQNNPPGPTVKEQVILIPAGALIEVKLKEKRKLRGRMGAVNDVKSVTPKEQGMSTGLKVGLGALAGAGARIVTLFVFFLLYSD